MTIKMKYLALAFGLSTALTTGSAFAAGEKIEFVAGIVGIPFYTSMECGARDAAKELGVELNWAGPPQWDLALQMPILQASIERGPNGLILAPTDPNALVTIVEDLVTNKKIPVVTVDGNLSKPVDLQNIRTDNLAAGGLAAEAMAQAIGGAGTVLVVGLNPGVTGNEERVTGFTKVLKEKFPNIKVLPTEYPGTDQNKAAEIVSAALQANPDLKGIYTTHSNAAVGTSSAVIGAGQQGKVKIIAYDADPGQVRDLKAGVYDALVVQSPYLEGYDSVTLVTKILRGEIDPAKLEDVTHPPMVVATRDNIDAPEVKKNLYVDACQ
ncbi:MAG TPA: ABC transporter substrate-binding protein [Nordella sp.]|nr:ABC transporter substrate-binding protein [Nordella sp.]